MQIYFALAFFLAPVWFNFVSGKGSFAQSVEMGTAHCHQRSGAFL